MVTAVNKPSIAGVKAVLKQAPGRSTSDGKKLNNSPSLRKLLAETEKVFPSDDCTVRQNPDEALSAVNIRARKKLRRAILFAFFFMVVEFMGGYLAGSLAVMSDAAHLLSDVAGFVMSMFAIWLGSFPATSTLSYGFYRTEVIGALLSVMVIWVITAHLFSAAVIRSLEVLRANSLDHLEEKVDGRIMFVVAFLGLVVNLVIMGILGGHHHSHGFAGHGHSHGGHGHSHSGAAHGHGHGHSHAHDHGDGPCTSRQDFGDKTEDDVEMGHCHSHLHVDEDRCSAKQRTEGNRDSTEQACGEGNVRNKIAEKRVEYDIQGHDQQLDQVPLPRDMDIGPGESSAQRSLQSLAPLKLSNSLEDIPIGGTSEANSAFCGPDTPPSHPTNSSTSFGADSAPTAQCKTFGGHENINVRAAYIHALGDLVQSLGVCFAGALIWYNPEWQLADPLVTFLSSILVLYTTTGVLRTALRVLMEGSPDDAFNVEELGLRLAQLPGVTSVHEVHIWSLTVGKNIVSAHLVTDTPHESLKAAERLCLNEGITRYTFQLESAQQTYRCRHGTKTYSSLRTQESGEEKGLLASMQENDLPSIIVTETPVASDAMVDRDARFL